jgi:hypothetical protein
MAIKVILLWFLDLLSGLAALLGALLVGWNSIETYYLVTGRVQADFEQPPLTVVVPLLIFGLILLFGGWALHKRLRKDSSF